MGLRNIFTWTTVLGRANSSWHILVPSSRSLGSTTLCIYGLWYSKVKSRCPWLPVESSFFGRTCTPSWRSWRLGMKRHGRCYGMVFSKSRFGWAKWCTRSLGYPVFRHSRMYGSCLNYIQSKVWYGLIWNHTPGYVFGDTVLTRTDLRQRHKFLLVFLENQSRSGASQCRGGMR